MDEIDRIRAFNRFYSAEIGALDREYLDSGLSLSQVRVLYELDQRPGLTARVLAGALGLDEGYISRMLTRFAAKGWVIRQVSEQDARRVLLSLSAEGQARLAPLKSRARERVGARIAPLGAGERARLVGAMEEIEALLSEQPQEVAFRDLAIGDAGWLIQRHAELYAEEDGFDATFEPLVAGILAEYMHNRDPSCERAWIAHAGGRRLGSVFCVREGTPGVAKLRLFLLEPSARGQGLGHRMLELCLSYARETGYRKMVLWTHESHRAACALYAAHGFALARSAPVHNFGRDLVEQSWEIVL